VSTMVICLSVIRSPRICIRCWVSLCLKKGKSSITGPQSEPGHHSSERVTYSAIIIWHGANMRAQRAGGVLTTAPEEGTQ
jgi:hypothetical protein